MNKAKLKSYAPQARKDFIAAVTARAHLLGVSESGGKLEVAGSQPQGDVTMIAGQAWPVKVHMQRQQLITRIQKNGFVETMEAVAYTWFNRFAALRYMELHDYLDHGHRVLSSLEGATPDILAHATELVQIAVGDGGLPGLKHDLVVEMKLAGNRDGELYSMLLVAQCNALSSVMPFLFERIDDETELLLPDNLLRTDSVITKLVRSIDECDWKEVEIIGWLYQFYIGEKKAEVIGNVVKSEDIPAATQLFTPKWIVQYLVQNSVGRLWLSANPASTLKAKWPYYIDPADQTRAIQVQLDRMITARSDEDGGSLNPETITLLDPACGSGHILVEAYDVLKAIYLERGYQLRIIPRLILEKNLFGLDIDDRAAQMAGFALLMKARADDRRLLSSPVKLNVLSIQESKGLDASELARALLSIGGDVILQHAGSSSIDRIDGRVPLPDKRQQLGVGEFLGTYMANIAVGDTLRLAISTLIATFEHGKTFGSLIQIPHVLNTQLDVIAERLQASLMLGDLYAQAAAQDLLPLVAQAKILGMKFDAVVANPPYMGRKGMPVSLQIYVDEHVPLARADLFACFIDRARTYVKREGSLSLITMDSWMYGDEYNEMRADILSTATIVSLAHLGPHAFPEIPGEVVQTAAFTLVNNSFPEYLSSYFDLTAFKNSDEKSVALRMRMNEYRNSVELYGSLPRRVIAYSASKSTLEAFQKSEPLMEFAEALTGLQTGDNGRFLRYWFEVPFRNIKFDCASIGDAKTSNCRWFPYIKGSEFRKWYGSQLLVVDWENDGKEIRKHRSSTVRNAHKYFSEGIAYNNISKNFCARNVEPGFIFDQKNSMFFATKPEYKLTTLGYLHSKVIQPLLKVVAPKDFNPGSLKVIPAIRGSFESSEASSVVDSLIKISKNDWDEFEISWDFSSNPLANVHSSNGKITNSFELLSTSRAEAIRRTKALEERNNHLFINAYGLEHELTPEVPASQITLARADREKDCQRLISYVIGCMMGRYCVEVPGLIYANAGNIDFDASRYTTFPADADGILPVTDEFWFEDDAASRIREFLLAVWGGDTLIENMAWLAESLGSKTGETPDETIRRYLADQFYKDHLQTYKKRPIYWLFSSGKQGAFQAMVYLHRYHEGTLARMRAEYVVPLTGKIQSRIDMLEKDLMAATSTAARNKLTKEVEKLKKKHVELLAYDDQLRHFADMRITLNLDDGVKFNYGKFGDLLAEVKAVTGGASDD
jgi:type II restriction/modification system DNA methylase subunit YeeA